MNKAQAFDRAHLWHPYTSMVDPLPAYVVESARGVRLRLADGRELIDGMASWWCAIHGYNHPVLNKAIQDQLEKMAHVMFGGLTHAPAIALGQRLIDLTPDSLQHVFLADSGSVSVEVAIKMALQYQAARGLNTKSKLMTFRGGYHGDTFGAMAVCDPVNGMHERFAGVLPQHFFVDRPSSRFGTAGESVQLALLEQMFRAHGDEVAAFILEPIVQNAGGIWFYSADYLRRVDELCEQHDVLLIADEIATGFGRTGTLFACEHAAVEPDILCVGKAMTGGYLSMAATLTNAKVAQGVSADGGVLAHGPTYMGNPLAAAVAVASIDLLIQLDWRASVARIETQLKAELQGYRAHSAVSDVRVLGAIGVVETREPVDVAAAQRCLVDSGVWLRPFGNLIYVMPPYVIEPDDLTTVTAAIGRVLDR